MRDPTATDATPTQPLPDLLAEKMAARGLNQKSLARLAGLGDTAVRDILQGRSRNPRRDTLRKLAAALALPVSTLTGENPAPARPPGPGPDNPALAPESPAPGPRRIPVYASAMGGGGEMLVTYEPIEYVAPPGPLVAVENAFGMYVIGESMEPAFEAGDMVLVHPARPARAGDDVIVIRAGARDGQYEALIKRLLQADQTRLRLRQYNPATEFDLPRSEIQAVFPIAVIHKGRW